MISSKTKTLAIISLIILWVLYALTQFGYMGPNTIGRTTDGLAPLVVPAGYAFSIWGLIYMGLTIFPLYQWFNRSGGDPLWSKVRLWYSFNVIMNGVWLVFASYEYLICTVVVIILMLISLFEINRLIHTIEDRGDKLNFWTEKFVFNIYFAWITLATVLNFAAAFKLYEWDGFGVSEVTWALIMLPVAALIAGITSWKYKSIAYAGVVIWAFIALVVKHQGVYMELVYLSIAVVVLFALIIVAIGRNRMARV